MLCLIVGSYSVIFSIFICTVVGNYSVIFPIFTCTMFNPTPILPAPFPPRVVCTTFVNHPLPTGQCPSSTGQCPSPPLPRPPLLWDQPGFIPSPPHSTAPLALFSCAPNSHQPIYNQPYKERGARLSPSPTICHCSPLNHAAKNEGT